MDETVSSSDAPKYLVPRFQPVYWLNVHIQLNVHIRFSQLTSLRTLPHKDVSARTPRRMGCSGRWDNRAVSCVLGVRWLSMPQFFVGFAWVLRRRCPCGMDGGLREGLASVTDSRGGLRGELLGCTRSDFQRR